MILFLAGCQPDVSPVEEAPPSIFVPLDGGRLARRISIDIRGVLPSAEELAIVEEEGGIDTLVDQWLEEPTFETHLVDVFAETWLLHLDELRVFPEEFGLPHNDMFDFTRSVGDEPARLMAKVAADDRPWSEIVTGNTTMANATLAQMVQLEWVDPDETKAWREARYTDGRPAGGVLMTSGLWLRYHTTIFNYNRGRAAALSRLLLCYDFLARPVVFTAVPADADNTTAGLQEAVTSDPGCIACHATLDPLASTLFGFWPLEDKDGTELVTYHPERERYGETLTGVSPGYFGTPLAGANQLGPMVAADPRFDNCTAQRAAERLWGRTSDNDDVPEVIGLRDELRAGDMQYKALMRAVIATEEYRAGDLTDAATDADRDRYHTRRFFTPRTLESTITDLTGFSWTWSGWDELDSDSTGYRLLLGGADGDMVRSTALGPGLTRSLVIRRLAQAASNTVVTHDLAAERADRLLLGTTSDSPIEPDTAAFAGELAAIHVRLFGQTATDDQLAEETTYYDNVDAMEGGQVAWASLLSVLLRDPDFWSY